MLHSCGSYAVRACIHRDGDVSSHSLIFESILRAVLALPLDQLLSQHSRRVRGRQPRTGPYTLRPSPYHPGLPRKGRIYTRAPARCEDSRAIAPYRILEVGASFGRPERPEMRDTRLSAYKRTHVAPRSSYRRIPTFVRTNLAGRAQKLPSARPLSWYDRAKLRSSWLIVVAVLASRETDSRFSAYAAT